MLRVKLVIMFVCICAISWASAQTLVLTDEGNYRVLKNEVYVGDLVKEYMKLSENNLYVAENRFKDFKIHIKGNSIIKKTEIYSYLSTLLNMEGYALLFDSSLEQYQLLEQRDIRFRPLRVVQSESELTETDQFVQFLYKSKYMPLSGLSRNLRPFMSRYGRLSNLRSSNVLNIIDSARNVKRILKIAQMVDSKAFAEDWNKVGDFKKELEDIRLKNDPARGSFFNEHYIIYIVLFSLIFLLVGFFARSYMIRNIEGGF